jgi:mRNA-degrading endonuclease toxin of MazEF toxin-antitoxin module
MKNFSEWNEIKIKTDDIESNIRIREGEIRWCRIGINVGREIVGKGEDFIRPVLILKKFSGDVFLGAPLTSKIHGGDWYYILKHNNTEQSVILNQSRLLDKKRLQNKLFQIHDRELLKIKQAYCNLILS